MTQKLPSLPPKSEEELKAEKALDAACAETTEAAKRLDASAIKLKRTISDQKLRAVRLPTPSQFDMSEVKK